jgi:hypothetical protein
MHLAFNITFVIVDNEQAIYVEVYPSTTTVNNPS